MSSQPHNTPLERTAARVRSPTAAHWQRSATRKMIVRCRVRTAGRGMRRAALTLIVTLTFGELAVRVDADPQRGPRVPRIGVLQVATRAASAHLFEAFKEAM